MPSIAVCSLARLATTVAEHGASHVVTLINAGTIFDRPAGVPADRHLFIPVSDIVAPEEGHIVPAAPHVETLLRFVERWGRAQPLVVHCYAGISRSTAAAFIAACHLRPDRDEAEIAERIRMSSPTATPNARLVAVADEILGRRGRMVEAVARLGPGLVAGEGVPFLLPLGAAPGTAP